MTAVKKESVSFVMLVDPQRRKYRLICYAADPQNPKYLIIRSVSVG